MPCRSAKARRLRRWPCHSLVTSAQAPKLNFKIENTQARAIAIAKKIVEYHGGRIWIDDNPGGGSIFAFTLPVALGDGLSAETD